MEAVKSIDALYEEVRDFDIVLCNDAPLTTALNNRVDKAMLGHFAVTPRQLAASMCMEETGKPIIDDIRLVKEVSIDTGYSLRFVHGEIENFKIALMYGKDPRIDRGMHRVRNVWDYYQKKNTLDMFMRNIPSGVVERYFEGKKLAVIGLNLFNELDKHMLPSNFDEVEITDYRNDFEITTMRVLGNDRLIAECAADIAVRCKDPNDVAIVIDTTGPMADAVKSALYRVSLPFINSLNVRDLSSVRNFLEFIQLALSFETIRVKDVRELISSYGGIINSKHDLYYLSRYYKSGIWKSDDTKRILDIMSNVRGWKFGDICASCVPSSERASVTMLLDQMECEGEYVSQKVLDDLIYAVNSINSLTHNEQISKNEKAGVLLVDCKNSVYIDRPVVVFTGMCSEWEVDLRALDYIDPNKRTDIEEVNVERFRALIQQGNVRYYLVNATKGGDVAKPCKYFDACIRKGIIAQLSGRDLTDEDMEKLAPIDSFEKIAKKLEKGPWEMKKRDRSAMSGDESLEDPNPPEVFSDTWYMKFLSCPRMYMLAKLAGGPENSNMFTGVRIHEYAQFRVSHPDIAKENGPEYYADIIAQECALLNSPDLEGIERSKILAAVKAVDMLASTTHAEPGKMVPFIPKKDDTNIFLEIHGLSDVSENTEVPFTSREDRLHGVMDLLWDGVVYDYKTGKPPSIEDLAGKYNIFKLREGKGGDYTDAQAMFYLALLEDSGIENRKVFKLFYTQQAYDVMLAGRTPEPEECIRTVELMDSWEEALLRHNPSVLSAKTYTNYEDLVPEKLFPKCASRWGPNPTLWNEEEDLRDIARELKVVGKKGEVTVTTESHLKGAVKAIKRYFSSYIIKSKQQSNTILIMRDTLELFKKNLREDMDRLREYYRTGFPVEPVIDCGRCDFKDMCIREIEGGDSDAEGTQ